MSPNQLAFIACIGFSEGTDSAPDPYRVCYGYKHTIKDLSEHPAVSGEWMGERLPDAMCEGAGMAPGCVSTAAGRGQLIKPTWMRARNALRLVGFGPDSQNAAIMYLVEHDAEAGALADIEAGRVMSAIAKCRKIWASFPGAGYAGQPERKMSALLAAYERAGGIRASSSPEI